MRSSPAHRQFQLPPALVKRAGQRAMEPRWTQVKARKEFFAPTEFARVRTR
jgi:hypothetical protein